VQRTAGSVVCEIMTTRPVYLVVESNRKHTYRYCWSSLGSHGVCKVQQIRDRVLLFDTEIGMELEAYLNWRKHLSLWYIAVNFRIRN
jgi:hypothetical protein